MNTKPLRRRIALPWLNRILSSVAVTLLVTLVVSPATSHAATAGSTGIVSGNVSNAGTGNLLEGARVEIPQLGLVTLTDNTGRYVLSGVPAGTHELVATYTGLDEQRSSVTVNAGQRATQNFDLTTEIYQLQEFQVTGEREGSAAAITLQRNAPNLKNVVAMDSFGNLPNMNASELAVLLPGVAGNLSDEGNIVGFTIRGMGRGMNTITVDGALMSSQGGMSRQTRIHTITGAMFDQLELTKGHRPDQGMDSLGGTINLKTRSPLSMKEKRRTTYNFTARWAPPFTQQIPMREDHRLHPTLNIAHQEVFDVFGGERNLGVAVNLFYSEQAVGFFRTDRDFQNTTESPAYVWNYQLQDNYNNRKQTSVNVKFDYRLSPTTKFSLNMIGNNAFERFRTRYRFRAFTQNQNARPNATTSGVVPGYTDRITEVRAVNASTIDITSQMSGFNNRMRHIDLGAEHDLDALQIDYNALYSQTHINSTSGDGGVLVQRLRGVGWILDRTESDLYPRFIQTSGPDISDPANYTPNSLRFNNGHDDHEVKEVRGNIRYSFATEQPFSLKTGVRWREERASELSFDRRFDYTGPRGALPDDPTIELYGPIRTGLDIPQWKANEISRGSRPVDPTLWQEDVYFHEMIQYTGTGAVTETVTAGYIMAQGKFGRTGYLAGVRTERTEDESFGWVRARDGSTEEEQLTDPVGAAQRDFGNTRRELEGSYTKSFPSIHLTHDITSNLKARLSWSTSFGRPSMANLLPEEDFDDEDQTLTVANPSLLPQTAENWDASLDYYFEPVGNFSVAWFHKTIEDFIVGGIESGIVPSGPDNPFGGNYAGYTILTRSNAGTAVVQGWEFSYQQQLTFLPGPLKGLGISANYTTLTTHGDFGGMTNLSTGEVADFIPRTGNVSLSWRHAGFSARVNVNYTSAWLDAYSASAAARNVFRDKRVNVNAGIAYQYRPWLGFSIDVQNVFNEHQVLYRGFRDRMSSTIIPGTTITFGVSGRF